MIKVIYTPERCDKEEALGLFRIQCPNIECYSILVFAEGDIQIGFEQRHYNKYVVCPKCKAEIDVQHSENLSVRDYEDYSKA